METIDTVWIAGNWAAVDTRIAERARHKREVDRLRKARERERYPDRDKRRNHHGKNQAERQATAKLEKLFIIWDGEGPKDTGYSLFGNSEGMEICYPTLKTIDCLELIMETEKTYPDAIHVIFGGEYDFSNILNDLSWRHLAALKKTTRTVWGDWEIEHIPHKWFKVKHGQVTATIFESYSFFMSSLVTALETWKIGPWDTANSPEANNDAEPPLSAGSLPSLSVIQKMSETDIVKLFKNLRSEFLWKDIEQIRFYMRLELKYTKILMEKLREAFAAAGYIPNSWHGPGALARMALKRHNVYAAMAVTPVDVQIASRYGYIGGRFSPHLVGHISGKVYSADINSAYPFAATFLPNLARGVWRRTRRIESGRFGIYFIRYEAKPEPHRIYPLPKRSRNGDVCWPYKVTSWFWNPEAELVKDDPDATVLDGWVFDEDDPSDRPFAFLHEYYRRRQMLKRLYGKGSAEITYRLVINAIYGQLAQRAGWDKHKRTAPRSHQLEWAGYITSYCRAQVWRFAVACGDGKCISIDTDGLYSTVPIPIPAKDVGTDLGQWELEEYDDGVFWQSGMYGLKKDGEWKKAKTRGIPRGTYEPAQMIEALERGERTLKVTRQKFIGYGLAINGQKSLKNTWVNEPHEYTLGGNGKVAHNEMLCDKICDGDIHRLINLNVLHFSEWQSQPHYLPWVAADEEMQLAKNTFDDLTLFDMNDNDEWVFNVSNTEEGTQS